jgi:hypothetical protein
MNDTDQNIQEEGVREGVEGQHHQDSVPDVSQVKKCLSSQSSYSNDEEVAEQDQK